MVYKSEIFIRTIGIQAENRNLDHPTGNES